MSESNRVRVTALAESTWGTTPSTGAAITIRRTGGTFGLETDFVESQEIRSDRMLADVIRTLARATGTIEFEMSLGGSFDSLFEGLAANSFSTAVGISAASITATNSTSQFTDTATGNNYFANITVGQWIRVSGFTNAANNGFHRVTAKPDVNTITVDSTLADESDTDIVMTGQRLVFPGTTAKSFTFEQSHLDIDQHILVAGGRLGSMELNVSVGELITGSMDVLGKSLAISANALDDGSVTYASATTTDVLSAVDGVAMILENFADPGLDIQNISISLENGLREQSAVAAGPTLTAVPYGTFRVTGTISAYFADATLYNKYLNQTESSVSFLLYDGTATTSGNALMVTVPKVKFTSGNPEAGALDTDVMLSLDFTAKVDTTSSSMLSFDKFTTP